MFLWVEAGRLRFVRSAYTWSGEIIIGKERFLQHCQYEDHSWTNQGVI